MSPFAIDAVGLSAAVITTVCWIPQAVQILRTKDTRAISLLTQAAFTVGIALWLGYGILSGSLPVIVSNAVTLPLVGAILVLKLRHG
jgi:MtN3 and saliva related transmembrane protein